MMWLVLSALVCLGAAQQQPYGQPSYGNQQQQSLADRVDVLNALIDTREEKETVQFARVANLRDSANANLDFANNVNAYILAAIDQEQYQQNARLNALEARLADIAALRTQVTQLTATADRFREEVAAIRQDDKEIQFDVTCLFNDDVARYSRIHETQQRADALNVRIDLYFVVGWENARSLAIEETQTRRVVDSVNRQSSAAAVVTLNPNDEESSTAAVNFEPPFVGAPHFYSSVPFGFRIDNPHGYGPSGYPTIYFSVEEELWNSRTEISSTDMSTGRWSTDHINVQVDDVYFDGFEYLKSDLAGIQTSLFY